MLKPLFKAIKDPSVFLYSVIALVMLNNIEHLAWVHHDIARHVFPLPWLNKAHSVAVVIIIELSIIVLVRRGQHQFALVYTLMLLALSLIYYPVGEYWANGQHGRAIAAVIYSLMFTLSIYYFARMAAGEKSPDAERVQELISKLHHTNTSMQQKDKELQQLTAELQERTSKLEELAVEMQHERKGNLQARAELQQLRELEKKVTASCTCDKCGHVFPSEAARRSHAGKCKGLNGSLVAGARAGVV